MTYKALFGALIVAVVLALSPTAQGEGSTVGWFMAGSNPKSYEMGVAQGAGQNRGPAGSLKSREAGSGLGTMMQQFHARWDVRKPVRLSAAARHRTGDKWAGVWSPRR